MKNACLQQFAIRDMPSNKYLGIAIESKLSSLKDHLKGIVTMITCDGDGDKVLVSKGRAHYS